MTLTWDAPQDDSIVGYMILRRNRDTDAEGEFTNLVWDTGTTDTTYTDDTVAAETPYTYRIKAFNEHGVSERSRWFHIDTPSAPEPPAKPTGVVSAASSDTVILHWDDPQDDSITGYRILRRDQHNNTDGDFQTLVEDTGSAAITYTDDTVEPERMYVYRVLAISPRGVGEPSRDVEVSTPAPLRSQPAQQERQESSTNRPGTVVLSATSPFSPSQPYMTVQLTAELTDPDSEPVEAVTWQWYKLVNGTETETDWRKINDATSKTYTPTIQEEGYFLRATASYRQVFSDKTLDQTAHGMTAGHVKGDISEPPGVDFVLSQDSPGRVRVGRWVTGYFGRNETGRSGDAFAVDLERGRKYRIDLEGSDTGRGSLADPRLENVFYLVDTSVFSAPIRFDDNSGKGKNAQITFTADATATHYIGTGGLDSFGTYRLTVQEIVDDLGVWYTDWGAEELGGFLHPYHPGTGKLYNKWIIERNRGERDVDGFLFYLGSDDAPLDNSDYILTVRGQKTPRLQVQTFYDLSNLDDYIAKFGLDADFIEFPPREGVHPGEGSDAEAGRISPVAPRPVGTVLGTSQEGEYHLVFDPGTEDVGAYLATISSHQKYDTGRYEIALRRHASMSEPEGGDFPKLDWYTKGYVRVGDPVTGNIGEQGVDTDVFATLLRAGRTYLIEAKGSETGHGSLADPAILQFAVAKPGSLDAGFADATDFPCSTITECGNDDGGTGLNARLVYSPSQTNLFYIQVANLKAAFSIDTTPDPSEEGTYTLSVTDVTGEPGY